ncbi:MAG: glycosyltransferase family 2 protein [candidate division KSB1 bacterium]|nr:glycosyltransferase family 2 protein [candidate division KSB1 bacterium]
MRSGRSDVDLSILVPLLNEEESLRELHREITEALTPMGLSYEIVFVDDGSTDGSWEVLRQIASEDSHVRAFRFRRNFGKSAALACGFRQARGRYVVTMDADLQDDPAEIPRLMARLQEGWDLVNGWKRKRRDPWTRRVSSRLFNWAASCVAGLRLHDFNCGLKAYRREVIEALPVYGELHRFLPALAHWQGFRVTEQEVQHRPRRYGRSKYGLGRAKRGFFDLITVLFLTRYGKRPLHFFGVPGLLSVLAGAGLLAYLAYQRLFASVYLSNRPLLFLGLLLVIVGIQFVSIGLIGEMITEMQRERMPYTIRESLGPTQSDEPCGLS